MSEIPSLLNAWAKANQHLRDTRWSEEAVKFGIAPAEWRQLSMHFTRMMGAWREAFDSDLPEIEQTINDFLAVFFYCQMRPSGNNTMKSLHPIGGETSHSSATSMRSGPTCKRR